LYEKIIIPTAVYKEIEKGKGKPYYLDLKLIDWIEIWGIRNLDFNVYFLDLDEGEAEVIILAKEQDADIVLMDEIMGRIIAKQFNLNVTGTIGVLLKAKERGLVNAIKEILTELQEKGTWLNTKLISKALELAHEE
jgi:predicted nucleic acid-binding protein